MNQPQLTPRDGKGIPKSENLSPLEKADLEKIQDMVKDERHALAVLATASMQTADGMGDAVDLLQDLKDILVKVCVHFSIGLPKGIQEAMDAGVYSPDDLPDDEDEGDEDDEEDVKA